MSQNTASAAPGVNASGSAPEKRELPSLWRRDFACVVRLTPSALAVETPSLLDFSTFPPDALHAYVTTHNLAHSYPRAAVSSPAPASGNGAGADAAASSSTPEFADADAAAAYLGGLAGRHFTAAPAPKEGEVVVGFLLRCKVGGESGFCTPQGDGRALGREIDGTSDASLLAFAGWRCATATRSPFEPQRSADVCMCVLEPSCEAKSSRE
jgi:hypothetical protein